MACGLAAPVSGYNGGYMGQPMPYGQPYGQPGYMPGYQMVPMPTTPPTKRMAVVGGVMTLIASALTLGLCAWTLGNHDFTGRDGHSGVTYVTMAFAVVAGVMAVFGIKGQWWGSLVAGILQTIQVLMTLAMAGLCIETREHLMLRYDWDSVPYDDPRLEVLKSMSSGYFIACLAVLMAAIFAYIGIGGARAWVRYQRHLAATGAF
jgi:hypothetical protein